MRHGFLLSLIALTACTTRAIEADRDVGETGIVGGTNADEGQFPYQVSIQDRGGNHFCGGSWISSEWVLSAAHCFEGEAPSRVLVAGGVHSLRQGGEMFTVDRIVSHPSYNRNTSNNDMALLHVTRPSSHPTVTLMDDEATAAFSAPGDMATVSGWGALFEDGWSPDVLQSVDVPILSNQTCNGLYNGGISDQMVCAGYSEGGRDSCQGDSGGPLVVPVGDELVQTGVVSWGIGCARRNTPGVYARVSEFQGWIQTFVPDAVFVSTGAVTPEPDDHGNSLADATPITQSGSYDGRLTPGDSDMFRLIVGDATSFTVTTTGSVDTYGTLVDTTGTLVTQDDDSGDDRNFLITQGNEAGEYFLQVRGYAAETQGDYELIVSIEGGTPPGPTPASDDDHGDTFATATNVSDYGVIAAELDAGDIDMFLLNLPAFTAATLSDLDTVGTLYDMQGTPVATNDDGGVDRNFLLNATNGGDFYLEIRGYDASVNGAYELHLD